VHEAGEDVGRDRLSGVADAQRDNFRFRVGLKECTSSAGNFREEITRCGRKKKKARGEGFGGGDEGGCKEADAM